jgi:hypothetical protein
MLRLKVLCALTLVAAASPCALAAQGSADVPLGDNAYVYLDALLARHALGSLSALERPYNVAEIARALKHEMPKHPSPVIKSYEKALRRALAKYDVSGLLSDAPRKTGLHYQGALDLYGTAESSSIRELMRANTTKDVEPGGGAEFLMQMGPVTAVGHPIIDGRLNVDPEYHLLNGLVPQGRADPVRVQEGYVDAHWRYGEIYIGREGRNSGPTMYDGLLLGNYTYSYDHLYAEIGIPQIRMQTLVTRLNDEFYGDTTVQRYFSWHRLSSHIKTVEFGVTESIVYGRPGQSFVFNYVNPFGLYYFSEINEEQGGTNANKMVGVDGAWRSPVGNYSFEWYLDDIQAFGGCGGTMGPSCKKPPSGGWTLQADGVPLVGDQRLFFAYTLVSNLSYRTGEQPWTDYTSYDISLGRGFSDYDEYRAGLDLAAIPEVPLKIYGAFSRQGQGDYRIPFPPISAYPTTPTFLSGIVSYVYRGAVSGAVSLPWIDVSGDVGLNHVKNWDHVTGVDKTLFAGRVVFTLTWRRLVHGDFQPPAPDPDD